MVTIKVTNKPLLEMQADGLVFFITPAMLEDTQITAVAQKFFPPLVQELKKRNFTGASSSVLALSAVDKDRAFQLIFVGLGEQQEDAFATLEQYRRAVGSVVRAAERLKLDSLAFNLPDPHLFNSSYAHIARETAIILHVASYHFDRFLTEKSAKLSRDIEVTISVSAHEQEITASIEEGEIIAAAQNRARYFVDMPPSQTTPEALANEARKIAEKYNLKVTVFDEETVTKMGMGGLAGVSRGSELDCQFVILEYTAPNPNSPTIGIVGKGITFDSGGLSLKPATAMETMKEDMSGAAAVIEAIAALSALKAPVNVVAFAPMAENLPSGTATKPGDILTFYNGKTAEVKNTDAEGRLILADALSYAVKNYTLDAIIDLATLTGACAYALGPFFAGLMGKHKKLLERIEQSAQRTGERVWQLPFDDDFKVAIKSDVADICNSGNPKYRAGAITAGFFLYNFVDSVPWAHLDIAGVAFGVPDISYYRSGGTGYGVRLLFDLIMNWQKL